MSKQHDQSHQIHTWISFGLHMPNELLLCRWEEHTLSTLWAEPDTPESYIKTFPQAKMKINNEFEKNKGGTLPIAKRKEKN